MIYCLNPDCKQPINSATSRSCESCGSPLVETLRGRYRIVRALGQGGFGKTFLAVDEDRLKARCVIKQFSPQLKSPKSLAKAVQLFEQEAIRLNELGEHPHIPSLMAYFEQDSRLYLVQQFIEGATLGQELARQGCFGEQKVRELMAGLLPILKFVHDRNVIHRDITPANIIRRKLDNRLILIDFGIAKVLEQVSSDLAQPGTRVGTEGYAPIEQLRSGRAFPASDLYSLGATCLYLMTQTRPDDLYDPIKGNWRWRSKLAEQGVEFSEGMGRILDRLLKDLVMERYQTADEVMQDLRSLLSRPTSLMTSQRSNLSLPAIMTIPPALTAAEEDEEVSKFPLSHILNIPENGLKVMNSLETEPSDVDTSDKLRGLPEGKPVTHTSANRTPANNTPISNTPISNTPISNTPIALPISKPTSDWKNSPRRSNPGHYSTDRSRPIETLDPSISGERISGEMVDLYGCISTLKGHSSWVFALATTPDGQTLASAGLDDRIIVWDLLSGGRDRVLEGHTKPINGLAITPDGKKVISCSDDISIKFWQLSTGHLERSLSVHTRDINTIAVSPDGQFLVSGAEDRTVCAWHIPSGTLLRSYPEVGGMVRSVAISANAQYVACGGLDNKVRVWNFNTTKLVHCFNGHNNSVLSVALTGNGRYVVSGSKDRSIKIWNTQTGELVRTLLGHADAVNSVAVTPDGRYLISGSSDKTICIWHFSSGEPIVKFLGHQSSVNAIVISPNQKWFASASSDNSVKVWKLV